MAIEVRQTQNQHIAICKEHPSYSVGWQLIFSSQTSGAGAADGSTVVDATRDSGVGDTYNGRYWVRCTSGTNNGVMKRVLDDDGSGTLTVEGVSDSDGFPNQVATSVSYELWKSPEAVVVVDSSGSATNVVDAERDEPNDYWVGHYLVPLTGNRRGEKAMILGFTSSTGAMVLDTGFSGALAAGDVCVMRVYLDVTNVSDGLTQGFIPRSMNRLDGNRPDGLVGVKGGTFGFDCYPQTGQIYPGSTEILRPPLGGALEACGMTEYQSGANPSHTTDTGCTTTSLTLSGQWEEYSIGAAATVDGEMAFITGQTDGTPDSLTVTPPLGLAPDSGATIGQTWSYRRNRRRDDNDYGSLTIEHEVDGVRTIMTGCKGNLTISGDEALTFGFEFQVDHWVRELQPSCVSYLGDAYSTENIIQGFQRRCYFGTTAVELGGISVSLNNEVAPRMVQGGYGINGRAGYSHSTCNPGATVRRLQTVVSGEHVPAHEAWLARTSHDFMIFWGTQLQGGVAVRMPIARLVQDPKNEDDSGQRVNPYVLEAMDPGSTTDPDSTVVIIPDFTIGFA